MEKDYKKNLRERKFNKYYWCSAISLIIISFLFRIPNNIKSYFIYILLFILVVIYFVVDFFKIIKNYKFKNTTSFSDKFNVYIKENENQSTNNLILLLKQYNFRTKNDLKLAIDYYNSEKPIKNNLII